MDIQTRKSILMDAFEELKRKWAGEEEFDGEIDGLPESRIADLMEVKEKYQLNDVEFLFIVGAAIGFYQGQRSVIEEFNRRLSAINEFVYSILGRRL